MLAIRMHLVRPAAAFLALGLSLTVAACTSPSSSGQPTTVAPPTAQPTAPPNATPQPANPTPAAPTATVPVAKPAAEPTTTTFTGGQAAGNVQLVIDPSSSQASYRAREQLAGRSLFSDAVGTTNGVSGTLVLNADGSFADQSLVTVDLTALKSDESRRDNFIRGNTLHISQFPQATFAPRQVQDLPSPMPTSGEASFKLLGDLTVHGVTQPVVWQVQASFDGDRVSGNATTRVQITDFGMTPPKAGPVLSIEDAVTLELAFAATRQA